MYFGNNALYKDNDDIKLNEGVLGAIAGTIGVLIILPYALVLPLAVILISISKAREKEQEKRTNTVKEELNSNPELKSAFNKLIKELEKDLSYVLKPYKKYITGFNINDFKVWGDDTQLIRFNNFCTINAAKIFEDIYKKDYYTYSKESNHDDPDVCVPAPKFVKEMNIIRKNIKNLNKSISKITKSRAIEFDWESIGENDKEFEFYYDSVIDEGFKIELVIDINKFDNIKLPEYKNKK